MAGSDVEAGPRTYGALCLWFTESDGGELFTYEQTYTVTVSAAPTTTTTSTPTAPTTSTTRGPARAAAVAPAYTG